MEGRSYRRLTPEQAVSVVETLRPLYAAVYSQPPYNEGPEVTEKFAGRVREESSRPGFAMVVAYDDDEPVGFASGHTMPAGRWWPGADRPAPPEMEAVDKFAVMEWAVRPDLQGRGIGQRLLDELLATRSETLAILAVHPAAPARAIYERLGWRHVGSTEAGPTPTMDIMVALVSCAPG